MTMAEETRTEVITLTPSAAQAVQTLLQERNLEGYALRLFVQGGGCSGLQYGMALEANIREEDLSCEFDGVKVVVDEISIDYLRGSTVDFVNGPDGEGFKIDNPNPLPACSCGSPGAGESQSGCAGCG